MWEINRTTSELKEDRTALNGVNGGACEHTSMCQCSAEDKIFFVLLCNYQHSRSTLLLELN